MAKKYSSKYSSSRSNRVFKARDNMNKKSKTTHLKVLIIIIPILIVAIFAGGIYFGYLSYAKNQPTVDKIVPVSTQDSLAPSTQNQSELLQVVNIANPIEASYVPSLTQVDKNFILTDNALQNTSNNSISVNSLAADDLLSLLKQAKNDGVELLVQTGYVSFEQQQQLYENTKDQLKNSNAYTEIKAESEAKKMTPPGGNSEAQTGLLVVFTAKDSNTAFEKTKEYRWLEKNGISYGFVLRYPKEHEEDTSMSVNYQAFRYVGVENAVRMRAYGMCLNEYQAHMGVN